MYLTAKDILQFNENAFIEFLKQKIPEGLYLDYKRNLTSGKDKDPHKEFLKDISAFANAHGGDILLGIDEPSDSKAFEEQIVGIEKAEELARELERVASSGIEPRISDLLVVCKKLSSDKEIVIVHIPPSFNRPHMVVYKRHRGFYKRHTESSQPMSIHEIKDSVMSSYSFVDKAIQRCNDKEEEVTVYLTYSGQPFILLQAVPLVNIENPWNVFDKKVENILRDSSRNTVNSRIFSLNTLQMPRAFIQGIQSSDDRTNPQWLLQVHRDGYVPLYFQIPEISTKTGIVKGLTSGYKTLFKSYFDILEDLWQLTDTDVPYLIMCKLINARGIILSIRNPFSEEIKYEREEIVWPQHFRAVGQDSELLIEDLTKELFYAFGQKDICD
jgi:hypothetical protein